MISQDDIDNMPLELAKEVRKRLTIRIQTDPLEKIKRLEQKLADLRYSMPDTDNEAY